MKHMWMLLLLLLCNTHYYYAMGSEEGNLEYYSLKNETIEENSSSAIIKLSKTKYEGPCSSLKRKGTIIFRIENSFPNGLVKEEVSKAVKDIITALEEAGCNKLETLIAVENILPEAVRSSLKESDDLSVLKKELKDFLLHAHNEFNAEWSLRIDEDGIPYCGLLLP